MGEKERSLAFLDDTIYKGHYYYFANCFLRNLQPDGKIVNPEILKEPLILKLPLR